MDLGCYALHAHRIWRRGAAANHAPPPRGRGARRQAGVDEWIDADLEFPSGATGSARCNMAGEYLRMSCRIVGSRGEATAANFVLPHQDDRISSPPPGR